MRCSRATFGLLALLAGCGALPQPFAGNPGATALRLAQPPPARLAVPVPTGALLGDAASAAYDAAVVAALQDETVPAVAGPARQGDWRLALTAEAQGGQVVPAFTVFDPNGKRQGSTQAAAVDAAQWADGGKPVLTATAAAAAPKVADLLTGIQATLAQSDPNSLLNRPARVAVNEVDGAPGDGNFQLARQLRQQLAQVGEQVETSPASADFVVQGGVKLVPVAGGNQRVEITWVVTDTQNRELGHLVQLNEIAAGSLDHYWGDVALVVAQAAAGGIRDVILNAIGTKPGGKAPDDAAKAATPAAATAK